MKPNLEPHFDAIWKEAERRFPTQNTRKPDPMLQQIQVLLGSIENVFERADKLEAAKQAQQENK